MFKILGQIPKTHFHVACSGGSDSITLVNYLLRWPKNKFDILHFNHGTEYCDEAETFVQKFCEINKLEFHTEKISKSIPKNTSKEDFWRSERYTFLAKYSNEPILMAHQLNDVIETWVMSCMNGNPKLIPYHNHKYNIYRPFLCVSKREINEWISNNHLKYVTDGSNYDTSINRNYVRHKMMEGIYRLNPGIEKTISKLVLKQYKESLKNE